MDTLTIDDIVNLYNVARQAMIPAAQAIPTAVLFQKVERVIARGRVQPTPPAPEAHKANGSEKAVSPPQET